MRLIDAPLFYEKVHAFLDSLNSHELTLLLHDMHHGRLEMLVLCQQTPTQQKESYLYEAMQPVQQDKS